MFFSLPRVYRRLAEPQNYGVCLGVSGREWADLQKRTDGQTSRSGEDFVGPAAFLRREVLRVLTGDRIFAAKKLVMSLQLWASACT